MLQRALMAGRPVPTGRDATYGDLLELANSRLGVAAALPQHRFATPDDAREELLGYLRFVRLAGQHIELLAGLVGGEAEDVRIFGRHLATGAQRDAGASTWNSAATVIGAAHDLLTSHLDPALSARTPDAQALLTQPRLLAAASQTIQMLATAASARTRLTRLLSVVERGPSGDGHRSDDLMMAARRTGRHVHIHGRAAMWDLHRLGIDETSPALEPLTFPVVVPAAPSPGFESALNALRTLRQLSYDQARGRAPASPASLRDLARLGEVANAPDADWLPPAESGLARVQRANIIDGVATAHEAWSLAGRNLTTVIQGITQAPATYAESVRWLQEEVQRQPATSRAVISALPALAGEASRTVLRLAGTGSLVTRQRVPMQLHGAWARIPFEEVQALIGSFDNAGNASRVVADGVRQLTGAPDDRGRAPAVPGRRPPERHIERSISR
jgi:hypothetical protein